MLINSLWSSDLSEKEGHEMCRQKKVRRKKSVLFLTTVSVEADVDF